MARATEADAPTLTLEAPAQPHAGAGWFGRTFSSLQDSNFRLLYFGNTLQFGSMQMQLLVRGYLVFDLTGSFAALGTMALANAIPGLLLAPVGGVVADRAPKKTVIQFAQAYNAINAAVLAILAAGLFGLELQFWHLFLSALLQGGVNSIMMPSRQSIISDLVPAERLTNAVAINTSGQNLMQLIGPGLGGLLISLWSPSAVFWLMGAMYALAVTFTMRIPARPLYAFERQPARAATKGRRGSGSMKELVGGLRYVAQDPVVRLLILVNFLIVVVAMPYTMLLPGFVREVLGRGAGAQGLLMAVSGVGAIAGSLFVASMSGHGRGRMMIVWGAVLGIGLVGFAASTSFYITLPIMLIIGVGQAGRMSIGQVLIQAYSAPEYRGRALAVWMMQFYLVQFGTFFVGILAELLGPQLAIGGLAFLMVVAMGLVALTLPTVRNLD
ncbi:MAG: MFS transporter [Dehalococcoidia bacterium]|nr:MFS transporter [Dehalococcoidia bacterium]